MLLLPLLLLLLLLLFTLQGPVPENQVLCLRATLFAGALLEYVGATYLRLQTISPSGARRSWHGGQPLRFLREFLAECRVNKGTYALV
jgi:hypothetical protein